MGIDIEQVKAANPIEDAIEADYPLKGRGRWLRAEQRDSLIVDTHSQAYFWNSQGEQGDVVTWTMKRRRCDFRAAIEWLCARGGLSAPQWGGEDAQAARERQTRYEALTVAARYWVQALRGDQGQVARDYCSSRGWSDETIQKAGLGFTPADGGKGLRGTFNMHEIDLASPAAAAALKIRGGMLIYPHLEAGRVVYVSARSVEGKRHFNPPAELIGQRRVYCNRLWSPRAETVVIVEGQADAITCGQWELPAIALAGVVVNQVVLKMLARHETVYVALDQDEAGIRATQEIADALGPLTRMVTWPENVQDANAWLQAGATAEDCAELLAAAPTWVEVLAREAGRADDGQKIEQLRQTFAQIARLDEFEVATRRRALAKTMDLGVREFDGLLKATLGDGPESKARSAPRIEIETPGKLVGGQLFEIIYRPPDGVGSRGGETLFAVRRMDGTIETAPHVDVDGVRYVPLPPTNPLLHEFVVRLPTNLGPEMETVALVNEIQTVIHRYVDVDPFYERLASYYALFSWVYDGFQTLPYLRVIGPPGTGKSRFIQIVGTLCYRPMLVSGSATVSPIFRLLHQFRGTLCLDEADRDKSDETADLIKIFNSGFQRAQAVVLRAGDRSTGFAPQAFVVFGPKLLSTRRRFQDPALESRCLTYRMGSPSARADIPIELPRAFWMEEAPAIRNLLLRWRLMHWRPEIELDYSELDRSLSPRLNQVTLALLTLVPDKGLRVELRNLMRQFDREMIVERQLTLACRVLEVILFLHQDARDNDREADLSMATIAQEVNALIDFENRKPSDKQVTPRKVGYVVGNQLYLSKEQSRDPTNRRIGVKWDDERIKGLRRQYGIDDDALCSIVATMYRIRAERENRPHQKEMF